MEKRDKINSWIELGKIWWRMCALPNDPKLGSRRLQASLVELLHSLPGLGTPNSAGVTLPVQGRRAACVLDAVYFNQFRGTYGQSAPSDMEPVLRTAACSGQSRTDQWSVTTPRLPLGLQHSQALAVLDLKPSNRLLYSTSPQ